MKKKAGTKQGKKHKQGAGAGKARAGSGAGGDRKQGAGRGGFAAAAVGSRPAPKRVVDVPVSVGQLVEADIIGIGHDGEGVGRTRDGYTLFIHGALPGEKVTARVEHVKKQYGYARLAEVLSPGADRVAPPCPIYAECGGCQLQHLSYEGQLRWKRQSVVDALERIGKLQVRGSEDDGDAGGVVVHPTLGMDEPWRYRNKAQVPIGQEEGGLIGGFYAQGSHRIIDMEACLIQHEKNDDVVRRVKRIAGELGIRAYDETTGRGLLRHVVVKVGFRTGDVMVVLVTNGESVPYVDELVGLIREEVPGVKSIVQNVNTGRTNVIFGDRTLVLWGEEYIRDWIGDVQFAISARSFYQVNPMQTEVLYGKALEYAALSGGETVIDAYCGIGTISLFLARRADHVYGVEIVADAIADARRNAELNGMTSKVTFEVGPAEVVIPAWKRDGIAADVIVVDPPRKGCDAALLETIGEMRPERVVYVSCNPATLARDLRVLEDAGYRTVEVQPVDMFPHTVHVECVALLDQI